jgi:hypothetical protein
MELKWRDIYWIPIRSFTFFNGEKKIADLIAKTKDEIVISFITKIELLSFDIEDQDTEKKVREF